MPSSQGVTFLTGALAGVACSAALISLSQKVSKSQPTSTWIDSQCSGREVAPTPSASAEKLMDSCSLDQRMIRKAEGAILNRTSRLIVVVERCTNDHNYSAILRTVEALGIQHVYIIAPQCIQSTLSNNHGSYEVDDVKDVELKRSSGEVVKRATESEKKDRAMHHLYAKKATEWITVTGKGMESSL